MILKIYVMKNCSQQFGEIQNVKNSRMDSWSKLRISKNNVELCNSFDLYIEATVNSVAATINSAAGFFRRAKSDTIDDVDYICDT